AVAQGNRPDRRAEVDGPVVVDVKKAGPPGARGELGRDAVDVLPRPLGQRLRPRGDEVLRALPQLVGLGDGGVAVVQRDAVCHQFIASRMRPAIWSPVKPSYERTSLSSAGLNQRRSDTGRTRAVRPRLSYTSARMEYSPPVLK